MNLFLLGLLLAQAKVVQYSIDIDVTPVNFTGETIQALSLDGQIPGPTLFFDVGDTLEVTFHNRLAVESSIHWHGLLLPNDQDGVSYVTTLPIKAGTSHTFRYPLTHAGTYWYHSHTGLQEQRGLYGAMVIRPKKKRLRYDHEYVLVLSDWTDENPMQVMANLKKSDHYYALKKDSVQSWYKVFQYGAFWNRLQGSWTRMGPMDLSDVGYDAFLSNGEVQTKFTRPEPGDTVLLRIVNASASTYFHLGYAGGPMKVLAADGVDVKPTDTKKILHAIAETYDVLVKVPKKGAFEFRATAQDGTGHTSLWIGEGERQTAHTTPKPNPLLVDHSAHGSHSGGGMDHSHHEHHHHGHHAVGPSDQLSYEELRSPTPTKLNPKRPLREVHLKLTGNMERYQWSFNNKTFDEERFIMIKRGERVRMTLENTTMMHHPIHLHGHFFRVINKQGDHSPLKHTVDVPPMETQVIEFAADEDKDWMLHCHVLYHMKGGMTRLVRYEGSTWDPKLLEARKNKPWKPFEKWYLKGLLGVGYPYSNLMARASHTRYALELEAASRYEEVFEGSLLVERNLSRFLDVHLGARTEKEELEETAHSSGLLGIRYVLPLLITADLRYLYGRGHHAQLKLGSHLQLLDRLELDWHYELELEGLTTERHLKHHVEVGLEYVFTKAWSVRAKHHSTLGTGGDLAWRF